MYMRTLLRAIAFPLLLLFSFSALAQDKVITGRVTDSSGRGVPGTSVSVKGQAARGTTTGTDGAFSLSVPASAATLVFSSVGYGSQEVAVAGRTSVTVTLQATAGSLNEVVVVGYGTARRKDLTGSVALVTSRDFQKGVISTPEQLIAGKVSGVQITSNGGAPGSGSTIRIRGGASLNASNDPLIVVDGVPIAPNRNADGTPSIAGSPDPLSLINPNDIESFSVLKDASAAAIYGSRASNGVIIITTKKGRTGKPSFTFSTNQSLSQVVKKVDVFSADEFRAFVKEKGTSAYSGLAGSASTNWQDQIYHTAFASDNTLGVSGGFKGLPYRASVGYLNQNGILRTGNLERISGSLNLSPSLFNDHLRISLNLKGALSHSRFANQDAIGNAVTFDPTQPVYSGNSRYGGYFQYLDPSATTGLKQLAPRNPVSLLEQKVDKSTVKRSVGNLQFDYKLPFLPDLRANLNLGYDVSEGKGTVYISDSAAFSYQRFTTGGVSYSGQNTQYLQKKSNTLLEAYLNYTKDIPAIKSRVDAVAGYSYQDFSTKNYNFANYSANGTLNPGTAPLFPFDEPENRLLSYYGRLNYTFNSKYLLTATVRRDASSRFSPNNRWGTFPSAALAWKIKDEGFLRNSKTFSDLKLRLGYGVTGQQEGIGNYDYISYYGLSGNQAEYQLGTTFYNMYRPGGYYANRKWEQTATYNAAVDYGFLGGRINGSVEVYLKKTTDLLNEIDQPAGSNFTNRIVANVGSMENRGVEVSLNTQPIRRRNLTWDFNVNATYNKNEITRLTVFNNPNYPGVLVGGISGGTGQTIQINQTGYNRAAFYVFQQVYDGNGNPVDNLFVDRNGDGKVDGNDRYEYKSPDPRMFLGATTNVSYNRWSAGFVIRANIGNYVYNNVASSTGTLRNLFNPQGYLNNGSTDVLKSNFSGNGDQYFLSDYYIQNASFLRMDNLNVGYDFGRSLWKGATVRVGLNVQNVFTVTKYKGIDPEINGGIDNNFYPRPRTYTLSANLGF